MNITFISENEHYYIFDSDNGKISVGKFSEGIYDGEGNLIGGNPNGATSLEHAANKALYCFNEVTE